MPPIYEYQLVFFGFQFYDSATVVFAFPAEVIHFVRLEVNSISTDTNFNLDLTFEKNRKYYSSSLVFAPWHPDL